MKYWRTIPGSIGILLVRIYQVTLGVFLGGNCRFHPSCSEYGVDSFRHHGFVRGLWLIVKRLAKCHPFHPGGYDPVPEPSSIVPLPREPTI